MAGLCVGAHSCELDLDMELVTDPDKTKQGSIIFASHLGLSAITTHQSLSLTALGGNVPAASRRVDGCQRPNRTHYRASCGASEAHEGPLEPPTRDEESLCHKGTGSPITVQRMP